MKKLVKILAFILTAVVAMSFATGCKKSVPETEYDVELALWEAGNGRLFLDKTIEAFKVKHPEINIHVKASAEVQTGDLTSGVSVNSVDLYMTTLEGWVGYTEYLEPLDDMLDKTVDGVKLKTKFDQNILNYANTNPEDGKIYVLPWATSVNGLVYNNDLFTQYGYKVPRTTNELKTIVTAATDKKNADSKNPNAIIHYSVYWNYLVAAWQAQYDGVNAYLDSWMLKHNGQENNLATFTDKTGGRYKAYETMYEILAPRGVLYTGSNGLDHTGAQTIFLSGKALMMPNGSWVENEMKAVNTGADIRMMKTPVISSIAPKLGINENILSVFVADIDGEADTLSAQEKALLDTAKTNYADAYNAVAEIRNVAFTEQAQHHAFIPNYASAKEAAKTFLEFYYSDEAIQIFYETTHMPSAVKLTTGAPNTDGWSNFGKATLKMHEEADFVFKYLAHPVFYRAGEQQIYKYDFAKYFSHSDEKDRKDINAMWDYEAGYWTTNWNLLLELAGIEM